MATTNTPPQVIDQPFANGSTPADIPSSPTGTNQASLTEGVPAVCSQPLDTTGLPVKRTDFNNLGYLATSNNFFIQNGGFVTFVQAVSTAIGGYPLGAKLWATIGGESALVRSLKINNNDNFVTTPSFIGNGTSWAVDVPYNATLSTGTSGYRIESDGFITQWMLSTESTDSSDVKSWPIPFPNAVFNAQATTTTSAVNPGTKIDSISTVGIVFMCGDQYGNGQTAYIQAYGN